MSLLQPGLGQLYNGQPGKGLAFFALLALCVGSFVATALQPIPFTFPLLLWALAVLLQLGAAAEAAWTASRRAPTARLRPYNRWYIYVLAFALGWCASITVLLASRRFIQSFRIASAAMNPTLVAGDRVLVDKASFRHAAPRPGDVVVYRSMEDPRAKLIQRVAGVGGERIEIRDKALVVDGRAVSEPYAIHRDPRVYGAGPELPDLMRVRDNLAPRVVPAGQLFLLGDNRDNSYDSRFLGAVPQASVEGGGRIRIYWSRDPQTGAVRWDRIGRFVQ